MFIINQGISLLDMYKGDRDTPSGLSTTAKN